MTTRIPLNKSKIPYELVGFEMPIKNYDYSRGKIDSKNLNAAQQYIEQRLKGLSFRAFYVTQTNDGSLYYRLFPEFGSSQIKLEIFGSKYPKAPGVEATLYFYEGGKMTHMFYGTAESMYDLVAASFPKTTSIFEFTNGTTLRTLNLGHELAEYLTAPVLPVSEKNLEVEQPTPIPHNFTFA